MKSPTHRNSSAVALVAALAAGGVALAQSGAGGQKSEDGQEHRKIVLTSPRAMDIDITQRYACRIHSRRHINVCALLSGRLEEIKIKEGQAVKQGDLMFKIAPAPGEADPNAAFANVKAPFDGIVGRLHEELDSPIKEGDALTTLSDNLVMWVYFRAPVKQYFEFMASQERHEKAPKIELVLADDKKFPQPGTIAMIANQFNNANEEVAFRADFPNPDRLLRHGQTGIILVYLQLRDAIVIPMQATHEMMGKRYVDVVDEEDIVHRREIVVQVEMDDVLAIKEGVGVDDRIVLEGSRPVRDGEKVEYTFRPPPERRAWRKRLARDGERVEYEFRPAGEPRKPGKRAE